MSFATRLAPVALPLLTLSISAGCMAGSDAVDAPSRASADPVLESQVQPAQGERPDLSLVDVTITGEGCGAFAHGVSLSKDSYTVIFDDLAVERSPATGESRDIDCALVIRYTFPAGWTFDAPSALVRGFTDNDARVRLGVAVGIGRLPAYQRFTFEPGTNDNFFVQIDEEKAAARAGAVRCGATTAVIRAHLVGSASGTARTYTKADSLDGKITWRRCP